MNYFVVMIEYRTAGQEAIVDPKMTRADVVSRIRSHEYKDIAFIHEVSDWHVIDVTAELIAEAGVMEEAL